MRLKQKILFIPVTLLAFVCVISWHHLLKPDTLLTPHTTDNQINEIFTPEYEEQHQKIASSVKTTSLHELFEKNLTPYISKDTTHQFLKHWVHQNPYDLLGYILQISEAEFQLRTLSEALNIWHSEAPDTLSDWILKTEASSVMTTACQTEKLIPSLCIQYADKVSIIEEQNNIIEQQLKHWVTTDAEAAILWSIKSDDNYKRFGVDVFRQVINLEFDTALFSLSLLSGSDYSTSTEVADLFAKKLYQSKNSTESDVSDVANTILSLSDSKFKDMLLLTLAPTVFEFGNTYDSMVLLETMTNGPARDSLQHSFISQLTEQQGVNAALDYLNLLIDDEMKQQLISTMLTQWSKHDIVAAHDWFNSWESASPETTLSLTQIAISQKNIPIATSLLNKITSEPENTYETSEYSFQLAKLMYDENPESAINYLQNTLQLSKQNKKLIIDYFVNDRTTNTNNRF